MLGALAPASLLAAGLAQSVPAPTDLTLTSFKSELGPRPLDVRVAWRYADSEARFEVEFGLRERFQLLSDVPFVPLNGLVVERDGDTYSFEERDVWESGDPPCYQVRALTTAGASDWATICEVHPPTTGPGDPTPIVATVGLGVEADAATLGLAGILSTVALGALGIWGALQFVSRVGRQQPSA